MTSIFCQKSESILVPAKREGRSGTETRVVHVWLVWKLMDRREISMLVFVFSMELCSFFGVWLVVREDVGPGIRLDFLGKD